MASSTDNTMASTIDDAINSNDEFHLTAIKDQIFSNLRIFKPDIKGPIITSAHIKTKNIWRAAIWDEKNNILFSTTERCETVVDAMRVLLRLTSAIVDVEMDSWEAKNRGPVLKTSGGIMYM